MVEPVSNMYLVTKLQRSFRDELVVNRYIHIKLEHYNFSTPVMACKDKTGLLNKYLRLNYEGISRRILVEVRTYIQITYTGMQSEHCASLMSSFYKSFII